MQNFLTCRTQRDKAISLGLLSLLSLGVAVIISFVCYIRIGLTSLGTWYSLPWVGFVFTLGFIASAFFVFRHEIKSKPENLFLVIVLSTTCFSSLSFGVHAPSWDVGHHFRYVVEWAKPNTEITLTTAEARMAYGPSLYDQEIEVYAGFEDQFTYWAPLGLKTLNEFSQALDRADSFIDGRTVKGSFPQLYQRISSLPASLVYALCTALGVPFSVKYMLTRLIYALIYSFVTYFGMKQLKSGKMLFAVVALLPTAVFIASDYSYDYWINAFTLFAAACLVRELQTPDQPITSKKAILMLGAFVLAFGPKAIYFPVVLLCLLIPRSKFSSAWSSRVFRVSVVALSLLIAASFAVPYFFITGPGTGDFRGGSDVNSTEQIRFILSHPLEYFQILFTFLFKYYSLPTSREFIGLYAYLGFSSRMLWLSVCALITFTAITDKSEFDKPICTWKSRTGAILINVITASLIASALYVSYTAVGSETVAGCQPRYLIPLLFCTLVFLSSHRLAWPRSSEKLKTLYNAFVLAWMPFVYMVGLWQVFIRFLY
ncbi:MAG: DUF2142 domain-containing protein [Coriobacteriia bacterium]|nr:DUF2142 domain-containing protein [Coriobacteriia bacterium]